MLLTHFQILHSSDMHRIISFLCYLAIFTFMNDRTIVNGEV
jgi:hypothetical protein